MHTRSLTDNMTFRRIANRSTPLRKENDRACNVDATAVEMSMQVIRLELEALAILFYSQTHRLAIIIACISIPLHHRVPALHAAAAHSRGTYPRRSQMK